VEWTKTNDAVLGLDFDTVIPGHGAVCTRADLIDWCKSSGELAGNGGRRDCSEFTWRNASAAARFRGDAQPDVRLSREYDKAEDAVAELKLEDFGWKSSPAMLKRFEGLYGEMRQAAK
jgi:hypothetical protein